MRIVSRATTEEGIEQFLNRLPGHIHEHDRLQQTQKTKQKQQSMRGLEPQIRAAHKKRQTRDFFLNLLEESRAALAFRRSKSKPGDEITDVEAKR